MAKQRGTLDMVLPAVWFALKLLLALGKGSLLFQFSGEACVNGVRPIGCINWFVFTIPFVRSFYSLGAYVASRLLINPIALDHET